MLGWVTGVEPPDSHLAQFIPLYITSPSDLRRHRLPLLVAIFWCIVYSGWCRAQHLRGAVRGRELHTESPIPWLGVDGQWGSWYERLAVLRVAVEGTLAWRKTRRLRQGHPWIRKLNPLMPIVAIWVQL